MSTKPDFSDTIFRALVARREILRAGEGAGAIRIIGSRYSPEAMALRAFANRVAAPAHLDRPRGPRRRAGVPREHRRRDPATCRSSSRRPRCCGNPTPGEFAEHLGLTYRSRSRLPERSGRGRHRSGRARGRGLRRVGGARDHLARRGRRRAVRPARARASRTTSASRTASRATTSSARAAIQADAARRPPQRAVRGRRACASRTASTSSCSPTGARSRPAP